MNITINDTIACDTSRLNSFINSGNYDYNSEIGEAEKSLFEKVMNDFYHWLEGIFKDLFHVENALFSSDSKMLYVWIVIGVIGILALLYFMYFHFVILLELSFNIIQVVFLLYNV